jgi:hypothetical protein
MTEKRELDDAALEALFADARTEAPRPSDGLLARIAEDAGREAAWRPAPPRGLLSRLSDAVGGWPGLAGLSAAGVAGLAIGLAAPGTLDAVAPGALTGDSAYALEDLMPGYDMLIGEG